MRAKLRCERVFRQFGDGPDQLDTGGTAADDGEVQQPPPLIGIGLDFGPLEREQDSAPQRNRVVDALQAGRVRRPVVVPEIALLRPGGDDQIVERNSLAFRDHLVPAGVDAGDIAEHDLDVGPAVKLRSDRRGDIGRRQCCRRDLVQQRLEQMIVVAVDQRDIEWPAGEGLRCGKSAEPGSDDDNAGCHERSLSDRAPLARVPHARARCRTGNSPALRCTRRESVRTHFRARMSVLLPSNSMASVKCRAQHGVNEAADRIIRGVPAEAISA